MIVSVMTRLEGCVINHRFKNECMPCSRVSTPTHPGPASVTVNGMGGKTYLKMKQSVERIASCIDKVLQPFSTINHRILPASPKVLFAPCTRHLCSGLFSVNSEHVLLIGKGAASFQSRAQPLPICRSGISHIPLALVTALAYTLSIFPANRWENEMAV